MSLDAPDQDSAVAPGRRRIDPRAIGWALVAAVVAVAATVLIGSRLADDGPELDGSVVLDTPGVFQEPLAEVNADQAGSALPDVDFEDVAGNRVSLDEFRGVPLVINLWFVNCPPCRRELADFAAVDAELDAAGSPVQIVGIDPFDTVEAMQRFADARGVDYPLWRDTERTFSVELGIVAYPVTLFVDADGTVLRQTGEITADELRAAIAELF